MRLFRDRCQARWHWGKAGFVEVDKGCFDGAKEYPETWCARCGCCACCEVSAVPNLPGLAP